MSRLVRTLFDPAIAVCLGMIYLVLLLSTVSDLGYARDEGFYFQAAASYETWFNLLFSDPTRALEQANVDRYWTVNHEHPALMKSLFALSHKYLYERWGWFDEAGTAYRFPGMLMAALAVAILYLWGRRAIGRMAGVVVAALFALMPRVFYHSHLTAFDVPVAAMWLCTTYAYWRSLESRSLGWAISSGITYGLLLNTKHNSWLLPAALIVHLIVTRHRELRRDLRVGRFRAPAALFAVILIGPPLFYATWPWIWNDTGRRLTEYVAFHLGHEYYNMEFLGQTYWKPPMPRLYAWLMTLGTVPSITMLLFVLGVTWSFWQWSGRWFMDHLSRFRTREFSISAPPHDPSLVSTDLLWLLGILMSYAPWLSSNTPIFGGTKHWMTAYPFLCLFAGRGFQWVSKGLTSLFGSRARASQFGRVALAGSIVAGPLVMTLHSHPWGLSAYVPLVGGAAGAATLGLNRTFWGYTTGKACDFLNAHVPPNGTVYVHDTALQSWERMRADGRIRQDIRGTLSIAGSSFALYHHEPHMGRVDYQIWITYGTVQPAYIGTYDGVPVIWVYARRE